MTMTYQTAITTSAAAISTFLFTDVPELSSAEKSVVHFAEDLFSNNDFFDHPHNDNYNTNNDNSSHLFDLFHQVRLICLLSSSNSSASSCSSWTVFTFLFFVYISIATINNMISFYKFIVTWNLIIHERRLDLKGFVQQQRRRLSFKEALKTHVTMDSMTCTSCCICLSEFEENEFVTACDDGCHKWFHRECLFNWLDHSNDCPICRMDMLSRKKKKKGIVADFMELVGFHDA